MENPYFIDWAITNRCNLRCLHCRGMDKREIDGKTALSIARQIPNLSPAWVIIEGGEPLLRGELFEILEIINKGEIETYLITNGMLLNKEAVKRLSELSVKVMVSVDGVDKESYEAVRRGASFERLKEAIYLLEEYNILDACNITIGRHNAWQIKKIFEFAKGFNINKIIFLGLKPCRDYGRYVLSGGEYKEVISSVIECQRVYKIDIFFDEPFFKPFLKEKGIDYSPNAKNGIIVPEVSHCIFGDYIFIETNGDIKPCTFSPMAVGNLEKGNLEKLWEDMKKSETIRKIKDFSQRTGRCKDCKYLYDCGGCRSRTFALTGNWLSEDPSCPLI
ncbi:MAG: radical SAM protein [Deltaproteobacteria bacterium]|nr:radical SAM protein [Deltaproteobacteria bacterium]